MPRIQEAFRSSRGVLIGLAAAAVLLAGTVCAQAQFAPPAQGTQVRDASILKPPAGARVAIVEFSDMECPLCGRANPVIKEAVAKYKIPFTRYDFPLPYHAWSTQAAINGRWLDANKSKAIGEEYRDQVYANQAALGNNLDLFNKFTQKFAQGHGIALPFAIDPMGKLAAAVKADRNLGERIGIDHTPTIWVVTAGSKGAPFIEVNDINQLFQTIDRALIDTAAAAPKPVAKGGPAKPTPPKSPVKQ